MAARVNAGFVAMPSGFPVQEVGLGLYGPSLFYRAKGAFHLFQVCNHWTAQMLNIAGIPTTPFFDTFADGLLLDLRWRSGLIPMAKTGS